MTDRQRQLIDERFAGTCDWQEFSDYAARMEAPDPVEQAYALARRTGGNECAIGSFACSILEAMLDAYRAGVAVTEERIHDAIG